MNIDTANKARLKTIVVTSGAAYVDIDALACSLALSYFYNVTGWNSIVCHTGKLNGTIPDSYKLITEKMFLRRLNNHSNYHYAIVDVSNPDFFENFVQIDDIISVYDHHYGFEDYWKSNSNTYSKINYVGSCATLIWEKYTENNLSHSIPLVIAELLYLAIISNTLNMKAFITTDRDRDAKNMIEKEFNIDETITLDYYKKTESKIILDFEYFLINDMKTHRWNDKICYIGQLELLDSKNLVNKYFLDDTVIKILKHNYHIDDEYWFVIISDIERSVNLLFTQSNPTKKLIESIFHFEFIGDFAISDRLWMRKEFIRDMI